MYPGLRSKYPTHPRGFFAWRRAHRAPIGNKRAVPSWGQGRWVLLLMSALLFLSGVVMGQGLLPRPVHPPGPPPGLQLQFVRQTDDSLPPVMQRIAQCESRGRQFTRQGKVLRGMRNPHDTGLFQINRVVWGEKAQALGYDLHTLEGNTQMARYIFENYGSEPWQSSAACWKRIG
ncbi:MAG: hypothetical protein AB7N91_19570 [Candidatus Tectimicrobiota bacterium]